MEVFERFPPDRASAAALAAGLVAGPTLLTIDEGAATARREMWVRCHLREVAPALDPRSWPRRNRFFADVRKLDLPLDPGPAGETSWRGRVLEVFCLDVAGLRVNRFDVVLDIDISVDAHMVRMDYALVHEKNDQLLVDDGYGLACKVAGYPGWTHVTFEKTVAFNSSIATLMAPSALALLAQEDPVAFLRPSGNRE